MNDPQEFGFFELIEYIKKTPVIIALIVSNILSISLIILGRLRNWLVTPKKIFIFSLLISLLSTTLICIFSFSFDNELKGENTKWLYFIGIFVFFATSIFIAIYLTEDKTAMRKHENHIDKDIPEPNFKDRLERVTNALNYNLRDIDLQTNWNMLNFVPLDAEFEFLTNGRERKKKVKDLLRSIKSTKKSNLFLVIGEPGSGKSVALRKLCQDLGKEVTKTGKIPVYINLKEWQEKWDYNNLPTVEQLNKFVLYNLKNRDTVTADFFSKYYDRLYEAGRLYFVFDSFDEIPSVLGEEENSFLIRRLSSVMHDFLKGARKECQGILASRVFRRPSEEFKANSILEIRPLSEEKINSLFYKMIGYNQDITKKLFLEHPDLLVSANNPFTASLLVNYAKENKDVLPSNLMDLYENYFSNALKKSSDIIKAHGLNQKVVEEITIQIANIMFTQNSLEIKKTLLKEYIAQKNRSKIDDVIDILEFARIGRKNRESGLFSFSHRRFCEFFVVKKLIQEEQDLQLNDIPKDSQWRDTLVMYCQITTEDKAIKIANYCWSIISHNNDPQNMNTIHCMRFLRDAFKNRITSINLFRDELANYILNLIEPNVNMVTAKLAIECLGLLEGRDICIGAFKAFNTQNIWLIENAMKACRNLNEISSQLSKAMMLALKRFNVSYFYKVDRELYFSLSLSSSMKQIKKVYINYIIDFWVVLIFCTLMPIYIASFGASNFFYYIRDYLTTIILAMFSFNYFRVFKINFNLTDRDILMIASTYTVSFEVFFEKTLSYDVNRYEYISFMSIFFTLILTHIYLYIGSFKFNFFFNISLINFSKLIKLIFSSILFLIIPTLLLLIIFFFKKYWHDLPVICFLHCNTNNNNKFYIIINKNCQMLYLY